MADQLALPLFLAPIVALPRRRQTIDERFRAFHAANPHVFDLLVILARRMRARGGRVGIKACWERLRWEYRERVEGDQWARLNNSLTSRYARLITERCPDLVDVIETRELRAA